MNAVAKVNENSTKVELDGAAATQLQPVIAAPQPAPKKRGRVLLMAALPLALVVGGGYFWVTGGRYQETENANLRQAKVNIASEAAGRIVKVDVSDNTTVKAGDVLFEVDPEPYKIALAQSDASLAAARLNVEQLRAAYSQAVAQERVAASGLDYARAQFDRSNGLVTKGVNTKSSLDEARMDLDKAEEQHSAAVQGIASAKAALGGNPDIETDKHPTVLSALAARDKAAFNLAQTTVRAPADGVVSQAASFKVGQFVGTGTALFSLVETGDTWIEANFKETQLTHMKAGQEAEIVLDTYPDRTFRGTVEAIGAGTGAEFSLLPAQNATGNWVKVTQRIPVRIKVDATDAGLAMRTGMSATVSIDTGVSRGFGSIFGHAVAAE
ncbi:HlyD family secretion protein [Aminobacter sp. NyZ550]|uniref:HlyD family secretion protein n=1 Tax=unclassified Aminobacter TaxID=2644704 RepID=UPI0012B0477D|nr:MULTISPECIES: HlyD family secretion protein [unclassified Aminobacter]MRX34104.1 HlyD family efflux transporter periplasmic adaptor subunit [Aminobacter sp. MDW-2]QNH37272.1 HlyD family secretion protein [Aminobacter sp. MDW-2]WAX97993.1 HlyD family secretion protein [Aminobacter sp. NyZ550]BBD37340.1 membrane protein [Aminobacter sp. SS-2016]